jgi:Na+/H+ antiporter NhaD/arsenite permease-like protein
MTSRRPLFLGLLGLFLLPGMAMGAGDTPLDLPIWSITPFVALLLCIALLPLVAEHWWHSNRNKGIVVAIIAIPAALYLLVVHLTTDQQALVPLGHELFKYCCFIILLGSLYTVAGGLVFRGDLRPVPQVNTAILGGGALLANLIGTTGASVLLIRLFLRINKTRTHRSHLPIFFILVVSNVGGLLTPLGDPPLFLGFLNGVPFAWTLTLWREWLLVNGTILTIFYFWDTLAWRKEEGGPRAEAASSGASPPRGDAWEGSPELTPEAEAKSSGLSPPREPLRLEGLINLIFLAGIIAGVLLQGVIGGDVGELLGAALMVVMGVLSLVLTPRALREANSFNWVPIVEVAVLFIGIFVAMVPALELLKARGHALGITQPWQYFWMTGGLSGFLDNAPTYLAFGTMAAGQHPLGELTQTNPQVLAAISCGAVFMGALTYIGNGPNFMVKAIADESGYKMPSFFGYLAYSCLILLPVLVVVTFVFFPPG